MNRSERITLFTETIWDWYARHKRTLPWRDLRIQDDAQRAYRILVSEVMLQQTQVSRVIVIYKRFLRQFPRLADLAAASNRDVILAWRGMGYNSRALRLRDAAATIMTEHAGHFPEDFEELLSIKGIGPYTAAAIRNFAFNIPTPCIDTNIRRILHRTFFGPENTDGTWEKDDTALMEIAEEVLEIAVEPVAGCSLAGCWIKNQTSNQKLANQQPSRTSADWHAALMDFGSLVQTKNNPRWDVCPLTARGIMKATRKNFRSVETPYQGVSAVARNTEPGRIIGSRFMPNRIIRGRIIEALRDAKKGLTLELIGKEVCIDWAQEHKTWLQNLVTKLVQEDFVCARGACYVLKE